jgi:hypothetical protein
VSRVLIVVALLALVVLALTGHAELALTLAPPLLIAALPASGWFPAEALIVARRRVVATIPRRRRGRRATGLAPALTSALARSPWCVRGPPLAA